MHNIQRFISVIAMFFATFAMVASSALPHHHHDDGSICITLDNSLNDTEEHQHSHNGCDDDCAMNVNLIQDASQLGHASKSGFIPMLVATLSWDYSLLPKPEEKYARNPFIYIEHAFKCDIYLPCGMRAPPMTA